MKTLEQHDFCMALKLDNSKLYVVQIRSSRYIVYLTLKRLILLFQGSFPLINKIVYR